MRCTPSSQSARSSRTSARTTSPRSALRPQPAFATPASRPTTANSSGPAVLTCHPEPRMSTPSRTVRVGHRDLLRADQGTPLEESLGAIKDCQDAGKIQHAGISAVTVEQIERARRVLPIAAVQNQYNVGERQHDDVVDYCEREGIVFVPYYPL